MNFQLSEELILFRESVARFIDDEYGFAERQAIVTENPGYRERHWRRFAELGWLGVSIDDAYGGLGCGPLEVMVLCEQLGRALYAGPFYSTVILGARLIDLTATESQKHAWLPAIVEGRLKLGVGLVERRSRYDLQNITTHAELVDGSYRLNGQKSVVHYAENADSLLVSARVRHDESTNDVLAIFMVPRHTSGLALKSYSNHDGTRASEVEFDNVEIALDARLGTDGDASHAIETAADHANAALCAEANGAMWASYELTLEYMKTREQFGRNLGEFQALQHRLVDVYMHCQLAQSMVYDATLSLEQDNRNARAKAVSAAKFEIGRSAILVAQEAIQLHGGIGMTSDYAVGHYLKRVTAINSTLGDPKFHLRRYLSL